MSMIYGSYGPARPWLGKLALAVSRPWFRYRFARRQVYEADSDYSRERVASFRARLARGETVYLAGLGIAGHNSGAALVEVSARDGIQLWSNDEEERFTGI